MHHMATKAHIPFYCRRWHRVSWWQMSDSADTWAVAILSAAVSGLIFVLGQQLESRRSRENRLKDKLEALLTVLEDFPPFPDITFLLGPPTKDEKISFEDRKRKWRVKLEKAALLVDLYFDDAIQQMGEIQQDVAAALDLIPTEIDEVRAPNVTVEGQCNKRARAIETRVADFIAYLKANKSGLTFELLTTKSG